MKFIRWMIPVLIAFSAFCYGASSDYKVTNDGGIHGYYLTTTSEINIMAYGADPTGVADSTTAVQAALTAGVNRKVKAPKGTFLVGQLQIYGQTWLEGSGIGDSIFKLKAGTNTSMFVRQASGQSLVRMSNLKLDGNSTNNSAGHGIYFDTVDIGWIENVFIYNFKQNGIYLTGCNAIHVKDSYIQENKAGGYYSSQSENCDLINNVIQLNSIYQVKKVSTTDSHSAVIMGNWFESNPATAPTDQIIIDADGVNIIGNTLNSDGTSNSAINLKTGANNNTIIGNTFSNPPSNISILIDSGAKYNISIGNRGGSPITTDNDGENYSLEMNVATGYGMVQQGRIIEKYVALVDSATPSVIKGNYFVTSGDVYGLTDFTDGQDGQRITICFRHYKVVYYNATKIILSGSVNQTFTVGDTLSLIRDAGIWKETGRCVH